MNQAIRLGTLLMAALLAGSAVGCTSATSGEPRPMTSISTQQDEPTRPREIPLDTFDACSLLPRADYDDFTLDKPGKPDKDKRGADECVWMGDIGFLAVTLITYEGVEAREGRLGQIEPIDPIDGFPAFTITIPEVDESCFTAVDIADGQHLLTHVGMDRIEDDLPSPCEYARQLASSLMSTLLS